jgi:GDPmannose 4,6-dehydratase
MTRNYRDAYGLFACNGILFNHESPRRGGTFVTRKITRAIAQILCGKQKKLYLGNLDAKRDWGYAPEYIEAMWLMLQQDHSDDYVIGTGEAHSVKQFVQEAFDYASLDWREHVAFDPKYVRPTEVDSLVADPGKARRRLPWSATIKFSDLVRIMVDADLEATGLQPIGEGVRVLQSRFADWHKWQASVSSLLQSLEGAAMEQPHV